MSFITVAAATLPSVPLDFAGNRDRILESIKLAKDKGAKLRTGPELEVPGYGCLDHHLEGDTFLHSWVPPTYSFPSNSCVHFCYLGDSSVYVHERCCLGNERHPLTYVGRRRFWDGPLTKCDIRFP
jgi:hypothetical protein